MAKNSQYALTVMIGGAIAKSLGTSVNGASKKLGKLAAVGGTIAAVGGGMKLAFNVAAQAAKVAADFTGKCVEQAAAYEQQLANVSTLLDGTQAEVAARTAEIGDEILDVSNRTGVATADLTDGMYNVISAFGDSADAAGILEIAAKSAAAGNATTTDSINLLSAVTKAYGDTSATANQKVSDMAFMTVKLGQTTYPELASSIQQVTSLSEAMNVSQEELFGVFATGTGVIGNASVVATKLKATYATMMKPTKEMAGAYKALGFESGQAMVDQLGLQGALEKLTDYSEKTGVSLAKMYGSMEAASFVTAMTGNLSETWAEKTKAMGDAAGMTETAFARQTQTFEYSVNMLKNLGTNAMTEIGQKLLPYLTSFAQNALPLITDAIDQLLPMFDEIFAAIDWDAMGQLANQMLPVIIDTVLQLLPLLQQIVPPLMEAGGTIVSALLPVLSDLITTTLPMLLPLLDPILQIILMLLPLIQQLSPIIQLVVSVAVEQIQQLLTIVSTILSVIMPILSGLIEYLTGVFTGDWTKAWNGIKAIFLGVVNAIIRGLNWIINKINSIHIGPLPNWKILGEYAGAEIGFNIPTINEVAMASGGIVTQPTQALIGEGGEPEAVMPLSKLGTMLDNVTNNNDNSAVYYVTFAPVINAPDGDPDVIRGVMDEEYERFKEFMDRYTRDHDRVRL